ncbi:MAG: sigma-70 family RNA polymerase sigma factor [Steroidobacteraceae bacterium]
MAQSSGQERLVEWFREWRGSLRRFLLLRRGVAAADIDDIAQEVFLRLLRYDRTELIERPQAYLYRIAANVSAEWAARSSRRHPHRAEWLEELIDPADPHAEVEHAAADRDLHDALAALPSRAREILRLLHQESLTYEQIAARLQITRRIVKRDVVRAYAELRHTVVPEPDTMDHQGRLMP